jgi:type II secretory pathway pseudopilin PulG
VTALQLTSLVVVLLLAASISAALRCATVDSNAADMLRAAANNAAACIAMQRECAAEGV